MEHSQALFWYLLRFVDDQLDMSDLFVFTPFSIFHSPSWLVCILRLPIIFQALSLEAYYRAEKLVCRNCSTIHVHLQTLSNCPWHQNLGRITVYSMDLSVNFQIVPSTPNSANWQTLRLSLVFYSFGPPSLSVCGSNCKCVLHTKVHSSWADSLNRLLNKCKVLEIPKYNGPRPHFWILYIFHEVMDLAVIGDGCSWTWAQMHSKHHT